MHQRFFLFTALFLSFIPSGKTAPSAGVVDHSALPGGFAAAIAAEQKTALPPGLSPLFDKFQQPPPDTRPGCYWYWINDNISKEGITKDLEAMARVGIGRAYIGQIFGEGSRWETPVGKVPFKSDAWWEAMQWAVKEGDRCGVEIGFFNAPGWSQSGGPWVKPSQSMRYLAASEMLIDGGRKVEQILPVPEIKTFPMVNGSQRTSTGDRFTEKDFQDVRVIAFRQPEAEAAELDMKQVKASSPTLKSLAALLDGSAKTAVKIGPKAQQINFELDGIVPVQSLRLDPLDGAFTLTCVVAASDDGLAFRELTRHVEERGHQGPRNKDPILVPFPETKSKHLRVTVFASKPTEFSRLALSRRAVLAGYVRKQLGETSPSVWPPWNAYIWGGQPVPMAGSVVDSTTVLDLSDRMDAHGRLTWEAPPGRWVVMRTGMIPIGTQCAPASPQSRGLEVDKMSREHIRSLFDGMVGEFLRRTPAAERKALKYVVADSYETGPQNWTDDFVKKFEQHYAYSPVRFLPCLSSRVVDSPEISTRFLWDWRRLVVESIARDYVGGLREVANENGLKLWLENYGHWGFPSEFLLYGSMSDQVAAEFWENWDNSEHSVECRAASSCSHIYGRQDVYSEAFTSNRNFKQTPASIKKLLDWAYGAGVNHLILHVYIHQPDERKPGITAWFGTEFNRHNTWFEQSKAFIDYTRRSSVLLKAGRPVSDVAYYIGENAPAMQGPRDPELPDGYDFDYINSDVLIHRATVVDGRICLPDGPSFAVLVLPKQTVMRPEVAKAIQRLVQAGATVIGPAPAASPSLQNYPAADQEISQLAKEVWGAVDGKNTRQHDFGKGRVIDGLALSEVLKQLQLAPDVALIKGGGLICSTAGGSQIGIHEKGGIVFKHRTTGDSDIYFLANTSNHAAEVTVALRQTGRKPWLWDAVDGTMREAVAFRQADGRTQLPLRLDASESVFVVLSGKLAPDAVGKAISNTPAKTDLATLEGPWTLHFEGQGAPETIVFNTLSDWSTHTNPAIRNYSGTASYETTFQLPATAAGQPLRLELSKVGVIATVELNGKPLGTVWTQPQELDISDTVRPGENQLRIRVTSTWNNRLVADASLPLAERQSYVSQPYQFDPKAPLASSGLMGPVKISQLAR